MGWDKKGTLLVRVYSDLRIVPMRWGDRGYVSAGTVSICGVYHVLYSSTRLCSGIALHDQSFLVNLAGTI